MAIRTLSQLKAWFRRGQYPTEEQFGDLIDSFRHKNEGMTIPDVDGLAEALNWKFDRSEGEAMAAAIATAKEMAEGAARDVEDLYGSIAELSEARVGLFDGIILNRNFITYPTLSPGDIVYSVDDNGFYRYSEKASLDPLATGLGLPGGTISTPKFSFMPHAEYMDGDAPSAAILYRRCSTAELYRYDAATASLVRHADASEVSALAERVEEAEAGVARLAPTLEKTRLRRAQRVPHLCTGRISINSVPGNVYRNKGFVTICRGIPYVSETPFYMYNYKQGAGKEHVDIVRLLGYSNAPEDLPIEDVIDRLHVFRGDAPKDCESADITDFISLEDFIIEEGKGIVGFSKLNVPPRGEGETWTLALYIGDMFPTPFLALSKDGQIAGHSNSEVEQQRFRLAPPTIDTVYCNPDLYNYYSFPADKSHVAVKSFHGISCYGQMQHWYRYRIKGIWGERKWYRTKWGWNTIPWQQLIKKKVFMIMRTRRKSRRGNISDWVYFKIVRIGKEMHICQIPKEQTNMNRRFYAWEEHIAHKICLIPQIWS